jgi:hypothetical protein
MQIQLGRNKTRNGINRAIDIYNHPIEFTELTKVMAYRYLLQFNDTGRPSNNDVIEMIGTSFDLAVVNTNVEAASDYADLMWGQRQNRGNMMLNELRAMERRLIVRHHPLERKGPAGTPITVQRVPLEIKTVYNDSQNVHNTSINEGVKQCATRLVELAKALPGELPSFNKCMLEYNGIYGGFPDRIATDNATYGIGINLATLFVSIWVWIYAQPPDIINELLSRMREEFEAMKRMCSTGHFSRMVNIIQGFTDDETLCIRISNDAQISASVKTFMAKRMEEDEGLMEDLLENTGRFKEKMREIMNAEMGRFETDYGVESLDLVRKTVNEYTLLLVYET